MFDTAHVADVMTWGVLACTRDTGLDVVAQMMTAHRVHAIVVLGTPDSDDALRPLWGIVTELDLVAAAAQGRFRQRTVSEVARPTDVSLAPQDSLRGATELMARERLSHVVVVDPATRSPVGILSALDIAGVLSD
jgi:CBS domain-containing protein